jgi:signal transduction histidine kinase
MILARRRGLPIFWQTMILLISSLVVVQLISIALFLSLPPPRPDFNRLSDIADTLAGRAREHDRRERALAVEFRAKPPVPADGMASDPSFTAQLADRLDIDPARVRLFFEPEQRRYLLLDWGGRRDRVPIRRGEPLFFNTVIAAYDTGAGWRVVETPPRRTIARWQQRMLLVLGVGGLVLVPFAWFFARRITRPIRRFADAADRLGTDPLAPPVPEEGPAELRVAAHALNGMQQRLAAYLSERTAMIGAIAHDLRTPLARIAFRMEAAPDEVREKVQSDVDQMRAMIAATIGFVRGTAKAGERRPIELKPLLARIVAEEQEMGRRIALENGADAVVSGDAMALSRLFQNLIDNAAAYARRIEVELAVEDGRAIVRICDDGPGLAEHLLEKVFHPFERGDPSRNRETGGIGLGLTIARTITEDHGGRLTLRNRGGIGLEARVELPLAQ